MTRLSVDQALLQARGHAKKGEIEEAQKLYQIVLQAFPKNKRAQQGLTALNKPKQSIDMQDPPQETINQLITLYNQGQAATVIEQATALTEQYPRAFVVWNILGAANKGLNRIVKASEAFSKVTELNPNYADGFNNLGVTLQDQGKFGEAIEAYERALSLKPDYAEAYYNMGVAIKGQGKLDDAIASYKKALALKPDHAEAYNNLGNALKDQGKLEDAITSYTKALALKPDYAEAYTNMGSALKDQGKPAAAIETLKKALTLKPDHAEAFYNMGIALQDQGKLDEAITSYNQALTLKPDYADAYNNMGVTLKEQGKLEDAITSYEKALSLKPHHPEAYNNVGNALKDQGKLDKAIEAYNKALSLKPDYADAYNNMGNVLKNQDKLDEALKSYKKALLLKPDYAEAAKNLVKLPIGIIDESTIAKLDSNLSFMCSKIDNQSERLFFRANLLSHKGEYDSAFKMFVDANHIRSKLVVSSLKSQEKKYDAVIQRISNWSFNPQPQLESSVKQLFILGPSRSGKSTLENLLIGSRNVCPMFEAINLSAIDKMECSRGKPAKLNMADAFYRDEASLLGAGHYVVTSTLPENIFHIDRLIDGFANSFCIFVKRDQTDIASEIFTKEYEKGNFYSYNNSSILRYLERYETIWKIVKEKAPQRTLEISFEEIIIKPQEVLKKIRQLTAVSFQIDNAPNHSIKELTALFREHYTLQFMD